MSTEPTADPPRWNKGVTWVHIQRDLILMRLMLTLMENLWAVASARYAGKMPLRLHALSDEQMRHLQVSGVISRMEMELAYYRDAGAP